MKFYIGPEELNNVIELYVTLGNIMKVYYLDGRIVSIPNYTEEEEKEIKETMLKQLRERNANISLKSFVLQRNFDASLLTILAGSYIANRIKFDSIKPYLTIAAIFGTIYLTIRIVESKAIIKDIRKSNLFLDMYDELQTPEGMIAVEELNFDKTYSEELNVNTLDNFSYGDVKEVYKKLKRIK